MPDVTIDEHLKHFVDFLGTQELAPPLTYADFARCTTRAELGISSLNMLILVAGYIDVAANGKASLQPEWVPLLDEVEGIRSVVSEIDQIGLAGSPA